MTSESLVLLLLAIIVGLGSLLGAPTAQPAPELSPIESETWFLATVQATSAPLYEPDGETVAATVPQGDPLLVLEADAEQLRVRTIYGTEGFVPRYLVRLHAAPRLGGDFRVLGYYMDEGTGAARASLERAAGTLTGVVPWSWGVTASGSLRPVYVQEQRLGQVLAAAGREGLKTYVLIHNFNPDLGAFDPALADAVLGNAEVRARLVASIMDAAVRWDVAGVHVDFEGVRPARRNDLTAFAAELAAAARAWGLEVSLAVPAKTAATAHGAWGAAYDYASLAAHADFLVIMAYDQHWRGDVAGPIAALPWVRAVIEYALDPAGGGVPARKLVLGIPVYGYDWPSSGWADAVTFAEAMERLQQAGRLGGPAKLQWHAEYAAPHFAYGGRTVWFENEHSAAFKLLLAAEYDLAGVAFWRLGQEDGRIWDLIRRLKS